MIIIEAVDNEYDEKLLDLFAGELFLGKILKSFYKGLLPFPKEVKDLDEAKRWFYNLEKQKAKSYSLFLLSKRSLHSSQLKIRLKRKFISDKTINEILKDLIPYLDDDYWTLKRVAEEMEKGYGINAIRLRLQKKGVSIDPALLKERVDEKEQKKQILKLLKKRFADKKFDYRKAFFYLSSRGYEYSLIQEAVSIFHSSEIL